MSASSLTLTQAIELAQQYHRAGHLSQAESIYQQILQVQPHHAEALHSLGVIAAQRENYSVAIQLFKQAIQFNQQSAIYYANLGNASVLLGKLEEAAAYLQQALTLAPDYAEVYDNLGKIYRRQGRLDEAVTYLQRALTLKPNYVAAHNNLGNALRDLGHLTEANAAYQRALALNPRYERAHNNLANVLRDQGALQAAISHYQQAITLLPSYIEAHSNYLYTMNCVPEYDAATIFAAHCQFHEQHAQPLAASLIKPHKNNKLGKLKVGYLSPDFHQHSVAYFIEPILAHHDHALFEITIFYNNTHHDEVTQRLQSYADHWINCVSLTDDELAEQIRQMQIDILVDLTGHTANNRLLVFARKPAPIQISYLGYPNTTGLKTIDYRITDHYVEPVGVSESLSVETLLRMPHSYFCYRPLDNAPPINALPAKASAQITFGCFNNYSKLTDEIKKSWAEILRALPNAHLLLKAKSFNDEPTQQALKEQFAQLGIEPQRIQLVHYAPSSQAHLSYYHQVDIALDTFPYNGATTTCEALWMGVPVVTLVGERHASRMGLSLLSTVGLTELLAQTPEAYIEISIQLANHLNYLKKLRESLRERMRASPLMDGVGFTRDLEAIYRQLYLSGF